MLLLSQSAFRPAVAGAERAWAPPRASCRALLFVEPDVFHSPVVVDAVGHHREPFDPRLPTACARRVEQHRPEHGFRQFALGLPDEVLTFYRIALHRLPV